MTSIGIILGSVRPGRWGEQVTNWIQARAQEDVAINLGSEFPEGTFTPSEQVDAQLRALLEALA